MKLLLIYSYRDYPESAINLKYFQQHLRGLGEVCHSILYLNGKRNINYTLDGFSEVRLTQALTDLEDFRGGLNNIHLDDYECFVFINSSCIGPILPLYCQGSWLEFLHNYMLSQEADLIAPVIEVHPRDLSNLKNVKFKNLPHSTKNVPFIHSYFFMVTCKALSVLLEYGGLASGPISKEDAILVRERLITAALLDVGLKVCSLQRVFDGVDWRDTENWEKYKPRKKGPSCPEVPSNYYGADLDPYEVMFFKNIRKKHMFRSRKSSGISKSITKYIENIILRPKPE